MLTACFSLFSTQHQTNSGQTDSQNEKQNQTQNTNVSIGQRAHHIKKCDFYHTKYSCYGG
ncbi:hypothetical protein BIY20_16720 [Vibrio panuliri]|uniref:Uncharacterized protein n=1 Tax=Vibrio panuliri TaxID=1381081 RepID=A0ABX3F7D1_9VIBR|nr:hypothetical protein BIY20_16720 [Vibrio panuliri]